MTAVELYPPLPPGLANRAATFVAPPLGPSPEIVAVIAAALTEWLPAGDFRATSQGSLCFTNDSRLSLWSRAAIAESIERGPAV